MKPGTKSESTWKFYREDNPNNAAKTGYTRYAKRMINKARRRESNKIIKDGKDMDE